MISTGETIAFTPEWMKDQKDAPVFQIRTPGVIARAQMEAQLAGEYQAGKVFAFELLAAAREGVLALLDGDPDQDRVLDLIAVEAETPVELTDDDRHLLGEVKGILAASWPSYRALNSQLERRRELAPLVALRRFCVGIEAPGVTFKTGPDGFVSETCLAAVDPLVLLAAGNRAFGLCYVSEEDGGNSAPRSSSGDDQTTSPSGGTSTAGGKSPGKGGKKTPGSRSPRGSGPSSTSTS